MVRLKGVGASGGLTIATAYLVEEQKFVADKGKGSGPAVEIVRYDKARAAAVEQLGRIKDLALKRVGEKNAEIFEVHAQLVDDESIVGDVVALINKGAITADAAVQDIYAQQGATMAAMDDPYFKERAIDLVDVSRRLIAGIQGVKIADLSSVREPSVILARDLTPSQTVMLDPSMVKGIVTAVGGRTSHAAIIARSLNIPAVMSCPEAFKQAKNAQLLAIDGTKGEVIIEPTPAEVASYKARIAADLNKQKELLMFANKPSVTADGHVVQLEANIGSPEDLEAVLKNGAEGIGLFRSEFLYMEGSQWPTEDDQFESYKKVLAKVKGQVVIRTLDIGGDKTLPYFTFPKEDNPFLGYRAIRLSLDKVDVFKTQLRALIRASAFGNLGIMFPMIATLEEFQKAKAIYEECLSELKKNKVKVGKIQVGMMVEIPAAAVNADSFARYADFFSIGTNDLIQYSMAADRLAESVQYLYQPLNPSILRLIKLTIDGGRKNKVLTAMCGEMAGEPDAVAILVGLGLHGFSMSPSAILEARRIVSLIKLSDAKKLAEKALQCENEGQVKALVDEFNRAHKI